MRDHGNRSAGKKKNPVGALRLQFRRRVFYYGLYTKQEKNSGISVDSYVIMPNHIHLLIGVVMDGGRGDPSPTIHSIMGWLKYQTTKEINKMQGTVGEKVFQRSFYDHIIRDREDYEEHLRYIRDNPAQWYYDELYAEG